MGPQRLVTFVISALEMFLLTYLLTQYLIEYKDCSIRAVVLTSLLHGSETWTLYRHQKLDQFHMRCLRSIARIKLQDRVPNLGNHVASLSGVDKQGRRVPTHPLSRKCIHFLCKILQSDINATDDIDIAIPSVLLSVRDTPILYQNG